MPSAEFAATPYVPPSLMPIAGASALDPGQEPQSAAAAAWAAPARLWWRCEFKYAVGRRLREVTVVVASRSRWAESAEARDPAFEVLRKGILVMGVRLR